MLREIPVNSFTRGEFAGVVLTSAADRRISIVEHLSLQHNLVSTRKLADLFDVSVSTIERDIAHLRSKGHEIASQEGRSGGVLLTSPSSSFPELENPGAQHGLFVGRKAELSTLDTARNTALASGGAVALVSGRSGIGKTRLVEEFTSLGGSNLLQTFWGRPIQNLATPPFWPWLQIIRSAAEVQPDELTDKSVELCETLLSGPAPVFQTTSPDSYLQFQLFEKISEFIQQIPGDLNVIVLDDLQWVDTSSLNLFEFLHQSIGGAPLLLIGLYDNSIATRNSPLGRTLGSLARATNLVRVSLSPMSNSESELLIRSQARHGLNLETTKKVYERSEGNPFYIKEIVRHVADISRPEGSIVREPVMSDLVPEGIRDAVGRRLNDLSDECRRTLEYAAMLGREFSPDAIDAISTYEASQSLGEPRQLLEEAVSAGIVEKQSPENTFRFSHTMIHETVVDEVPLSRQANMHAIIANALERMYSAEKRRHPEELARHFVPAVPVLGVDRAVEYSMLAGRHAMSKFAYEEAATQFSNVLDFRPDQVGEDIRKEALGRLSQAMARFSMRGGKTRVVDSLKEAVSHFVSNEQIDRAVEFAMTDIMPNSPGADDGTDICGLIELVINRVPEGSRERSMLLARYAIALISEQRDLTSAKRIAEEARCIGRRVRDPYSTLLADRALVAIDFRDSLDTDSVIDGCERLQRDAMRIGDPETELRALWYKASRLMSHGDHVKANHAAEDFLERAEKYRDSIGLQQALGMNANIAIRNGDWERAETLADRNLRVFGEDTWATAALNNLAVIHAYAHEIKKITDFVCQGPASREIARVGLAIQLICNRPETIDARFVKGCQYLVQRGEMLTLNNQTVTAGLTLECLLAALDGDRIRAMSLCEELSDPDVPILQTVGAHPKRLTAKIYHLLGEFNRATEHLAEAIVYYRQGDTRPELAASLTDLAEISVSEKRSAKIIHELLDEAESIAGLLNMSPLLARISDVREALLATAQVGRSPDGLTPREIEVLQLVADGNTNRAISDLLFVSENTVTRHITNIFSKIRVKNRANATAYAFRSGLNRL